MIKYPNGKTFIEEEIKVKKTNHFSSANRGMVFEKLINQSNQYYLDNGIALIYKRTTPINVVKVDYKKGARITDAYFEKQSTTDYNGVYKGKYVDFEAKNTISKSSFPLNNIYPHQIEHLKKVLRHKGLAFFIIRFQHYNEIYLLDAKYVINFYENGKRKSIPYNAFKEKGILLEQTYNPPIKYIEGIDKIISKK